MALFLLKRSLQSITNFKFSNINPSQEHTMKTGISIKRWLTRAILPVAAACSLAAQAAEPLKIGYSDWPGWVAWQVAIDKGWFKDAGVDVKFEWFDYSASMDAFAAGKLDAYLVLLDRRKRVDDAIYGLSRIVRVKR